MYGLHNLPSTDEPAMRQGLAALWPLTPGKKSMFIHTATVMSRQRFQYSDTWRAERITIAGRPRDTIVVRRTQQSLIPGRVFTRYTGWCDISTRAWIKLDIQVLQGRSGAQPFEATAIKLP